MFVCGVLSTRRAGVMAIALVVVRYRGAPSPLVALVTAGFRTNGNRRVAHSPVLMCDCATIQLLCLLCPPSYLCVIARRYGCCLCLCFPRRFLFDVLLLARKCALIWIAVSVKDPFLSSLLALLSGVTVWAVAVTWKPFPKQLQLRSLQTVILSLQVLMLLQSSAHALPTTMTALHALWLALLCVVLASSVYSVGVRSAVY